MLRARSQSTMITLHDILTIPTKLQATYILIHTGGVALGPTMNNKSVAKLKCYTLVAQCCCCSVYVIPYWILSIECETGNGLEAVSHFLFLSRFSINIT